MRGRRAGVGGLGSHRREPDGGDHDGGDGDEGQAKERAEPAEGRNLAADDAAAEDHQQADDEEGSGENGEADADDPCEGGRGIVQIAAGMGIQRGHALRDCWGGNGEISRSQEVGVI